MKKFFLWFFTLLVFSFSVHGQRIVTPGQYLKRTLYDNAGKPIHEITVPGIPPGFYVPVAVPSRSAVLLSDIPAYDWSFGCSATSAAMPIGIGNFFIRKIFYLNKNR